MEPITMIVAALVLGAAAGMQEVAQQAVVDAYAGLRTLIVRKYGDVDVAALEKKPASKSRQSVLEEELLEAGADQDGEVMAQAQAVLDATATHDPGLAEVVGVRLVGVQSGGSIRVEDVESTGSGVVITDSKADQDITVKGVRAGTGPAPKAKRQ